MKISPEILAALRQMGLNTNSPDIMKIVNSDVFLQGVNMNCHGMSEIMNSNAFSKTTRNGTHKMRFRMGVSVKLPLEFKTRKAICKLVESLDIKTNPQLSCGVYDESRECDDNVKAFESHYVSEMDTLEQLQNTSTEQQFDSKCAELLQHSKRPIFNFLYTASEAELVNFMKRREVDFHFHKDSETPTAMKKKLDDGVKFFKKCGVEDSNIQTGCSINA